MSVEIIDPDGVLDLKFKCPKCGSSKFGTGEIDDKSTGYCHGDINDRMKCRYTWERPKDDDKVFVKKDKSDE
jgi:hypothetical protein